MARVKKRQPRTPRRLVTVDDLTARQRVFIAHYLGDCRLNATLAAQRAGYGGHPNTIGPRLLKSPAVQAAIDAMLDQVGLSADEVLAHLSELATGTIEDFLDAKNQLSLKEGKKRGKLHLVKKVKVGPDGAILDIQLHDRESALDKVARIRRMYGDDQRVGSQVDVDVIAEAAKIREARRADGLS